MSKHAASAAQRPSPALTPEAAEAKRAKAETIGRYAAIFIMPLLMVGIMITGYLAAMHSPAPRDMPITVSGHASQAGPFAQDLKMADPDAVDIRFADSAEQARQQVLDRDVAAAVSIQGNHATLYTAGSAGVSQASAVTALIQPEALTSGLSLETKDLKPLPASDTSGMGAMFLTTALVMAGYLPFSVLLSNSPELLRFRRIVPLLAGWSALVAGISWWVTGPLMGIVAPGHAPRSWGWRPWGCSPSAACSCS